MICNIYDAYQSKRTASAMYVCLCHAFTEGDVRAASTPGGTVAELYRALEARPSCGKCVPMVRDLIRPPAGTGMTERSPLGA